MQINQIIWSINMKQNSSKKQFNLVDSRYPDKYFCIYRDRSNPRHAQEHHSISLFGARVSAGQAPRRAMLRRLGAGADPALSPCVASNNSRAGHGSTEQVDRRRARRGDLVPTLGQGGSSLQSVLRTTIVRWGDIDSLISSCTDSSQ